LERIVDGVAGTVSINICVMPRFDYGSVRPWIRQFDSDLHCAIGGNQALLIRSDADLVEVDQHQLLAQAEI
jgi:hypothetical protein